MLIPALLVAPQLLGGLALTPKAVAGLSAVHVAVAALVGAAQNRLRGTADLALVARVGAPMVPAALVGGALSGALTDAALLGVYAAMATVALGLLLAPTRAATDDEAPVRPAWGPAAAVGATVGLLAGVVGAGGAFMLIPLLVRVLGVPLRTAVGSSLAITLVGAVGTLLGKLAGNQVPWGLTPWIVCGAVPGVIAGVRLGHQLPTRSLRRILVGLVTIVALHAWVNTLRWLGPTW